MTMRWYAANPDRRTAQVMTDLAVVGWFVLCLWLANGVQSRFDDLWYQCTSIGWVQSGTIASQRRGTAGACTQYLPR